MVSEGRRDGAVAFIEKLEAAVVRSVQKVVGEAEGNHVKALKGALADAQKKLAEQSSER